MRPDYTKFFQTIEDAMDPEDLRKFRVLKNRYMQYFKHALREACTGEFDRGRDTNVEFRRLADD